MWNALVCQWWCRWWCQLRAGRLSVAKCQIFCKHVHFAALCVDQLLTTAPSKEPTSGLVLWSPSLRREDWNIKTRILSMWSILSGTLSKNGILWEFFSFSRHVLVGVNCQVIVDKLKSFWSVKACFTRVGGDLGNFPIKSHHFSQDWL